MAGWPKILLLEGGLAFLLLTHRPIDAVSGDDGLLKVKSNYEVLLLHMLLVYVNYFLHLIVASHEDT